MYQANQHAIKPSPILPSFFGGRRRLETYSSLFTIDGKIGTGVSYLRLMGVDEFPYVFPDDLSGLPLEKKIKFDY